MTAARPTTRSPSILRRGLVPLLFAAALVATCLAYRCLTDPDRIRRIVIQRFEQRTGLELRIGSAAFSLWDGITLNDVSIRSADGNSDPVAEGMAPRVQFSCGKVRLRLERWSPVRGLLSIDAVTAYEPHVDLVLGPSSEVVAPADVRSAPWATVQTDTASWPSVIELSDARLRLLRSGQRGPGVVDELVATVRARRSDAHPQVYDLVWSAPGEPVELTGRIQLDLDPPTVRGIRGGLPPVAIQALMLLGEQRLAGAAEWSDRLALDGTVRARSYTLVPEAGVGAVELELSDLSLSIPVSEQEVPLGPDERYLQFRDMTGVLRAGKDGISADLAGRFQDSECSVRFSSTMPVRDLDALDDLVLDVQLAVRDLYVPANDARASTRQRRFIDRWPGLARWFREFEPHGMADIDLGATLQGRGDPALTIDRIRIAATDADVLWRHIAYPLSGVEGTVLVERDGPVSVTLHGRRKSAEVSVEIAMDRPHRCAPATVQITGEHVPVDDVLLATIPDQYRELFTSWEPAGTTDLSIRLLRPACSDGRPNGWRPEVRASLHGMSAEFNALGLAMDGLTGTIEFADDGIELRQIEGTALGGRFHADGTLAVESGELGAVKLTLEADDLRFGSLSPAALPDELRRLMASLRPTGGFDLHTELLRDSARGPLVQTTRVSLHDVTLGPDADVPAVTGLTGDVVATGDTVRVDGAEFRIGEAVVRASGLVERTAGRSVLSLDFSTEQFDVERDVVGLLPDAVRQAFDGWNIVGSLDLQLTAEREESDDATWKPRLANIKLHNATVAHAPSAIPLTGVEAELIWDGDRVHVPVFQGRYHDTEVAGSFVYDRRASVASACLDARGVVLDGSLRGILPARLRNLWDQLAPRGTVDLESVSLECQNIAQRNEGEESCARPAPVCSIDGGMRLREVGIGQGRHVGGINGVIAGAGRILDADGGATLDGTMELSAANAWHRTLRDVECNWTFFQTGDGIGSVRLDGFQADLYGGAVAGEMEIAFRPGRATYGLHTTWQGVSLPDFVAADPHAGIDGNAAEVRGRIDAQAYITGVFGDLRERRGGGRVELRDGHLYRLPLILAILHVLNLSSPENDAFEEAATSFYVVGREVQLSRIILTNQTLALVGSGTMSLPDRGVDLQLINAPTHVLAKVPILTDLLQGASRELMELHVTGPLYRPTVRARPLRALTDEIRDLFQKRRPAAVVPGPS